MHYRTERRRLFLLVWGYQGNGACALKRISADAAYGFRRMAQTKHVVEGNRFDVEVIQYSGDAHWMTYDQARQVAIRWYRGDARKINLGDRS